MILNVREFEREKDERDGVLNQKTLPKLIHLSNTASENNVGKLLMIYSPRKTVRTLVAFYV